MRKIREILTHRYTHGLSLENTVLAVRKSKGCFYSTCADFKASGLPWQLPPDITDEQLERSVFPEKIPALHGNSKVPLPDLTYIEQVLAKKHITIQILYREYRNSILFTSSHKTPAPIIIFFVLIILKYTNSLYNFIAQKENLEYNYFTLHPYTFNIVKQYQSNKGYSEFFHLQ